MPIPVKTFGDYVVCFSADPEWISMRKHFINECGWTPAQFRRIEPFAWFSAEVTIWKDGIELASDFLGTCCYKTAAEFYTVYAGDYFSDMVHDCALEIKNPALLAMVDAWCKALELEKAAYLENLHAKRSKATKLSGVAKS